MSMLRTCIASCGEIAVHIHGSANLPVHDFLSAKAPAATANVSWGRLGIQLTATSYLHDERPPGELITSVRAVVHMNGSVVVLENADGRHFLPGGRLKASESYEEALTREVQEECGLKVIRMEFMGVVHLHHETPKPELYPYPYPDMFHLIYSAAAAGTLRSGDTDGYEKSAVLMKPAKAMEIQGTEFAVPFLRHVLSGE